MGKKIRAGIPSLKSYATDSKEEASLSLIGGTLKRMMPKLMVIRYRSKTFGKLYEKLNRYEQVMTDKWASAVQLKS